MISATSNIKQPPNIFTSYLHLYYMKSKSKNQPKSKNNSKNQSKNRTVSSLKIAHIGLKIACAFTAYALKLV